MIFYQKLFKRLQSLWNMLSEKGQKQDKFVIYLLLIEVFVIILILGIKAANLAVALGTISMGLAIVYIEIIKPWLQKPKIQIEFDNKRPFCLPVKTVPGNCLHYHIRLKVTNEGELMAKRVRGKLVGVNTGNKIIDEFFDPLFLHWTSIEPIRGLGKLGFQTSAPYLGPIDLNAKEWDYLDVFSTDEKRRNVILIATSLQPRGCLKQFIMRERAILKITIHGENIKPVPKIYELVWANHNKNKIVMFEKKKRKVNNG